jgi:Ca2+/H+ antiporter
VSAESFLSSVVEVAIGMAGFAGIVAAIRQRDITRWPQQQRLLLQMLFAASAAAIAFALLPALLAEAELSRPTVWRFGSGALVIWFVSIGAFRFDQARRNAVPFPFRGGFAAWTGFLVLLQTLNLALSVSWPYLIGAFGLLVNGFIFFLRLLLGDLDGQREET